MRYLLAVVCFTLCIISCNLLQSKKEQPAVPRHADTVNRIKDSIYADTSDPMYINTGDTKPEELVSYAQMFIGVPYVYAASSPSVGFDCSGFITYVFNHFNIEGLRLFRFKNRIQFYQGTP